MPCSGLLLHGALKSSALKELKERRSAVSVLASESPLTYRTSVRYKEIGLLLRLCNQSSFAPLILRDVFLKVFPPGSLHSMP